MAVWRRTQTPRASTVLVMTPAMRRSTSSLALLTRWFSDCRALPAVVPDLLVMPSPSSSSSSSSSFSSSMLTSSRTACQRSSSGRSSRNELIVNELLMNAHNCRSRRTLCAAEFLPPPRPSVTIYTNTKVKVRTLDIALFHESSPRKRSRMARRVLKGSHSCSPAHPHVHTQSEWAFIDNVLLKSCDANARLKRVKRAEMQKKTSKDNASAQIQKETRMALSRAHISAKAQQTL